MKKLLIVLSVILAAGFTTAAEYKLGEKESCFESGKAPVMQDGNMKLGGFVHFWSRKMFRYNPAKKYSVYADVRTDFNGPIPSMTIGFVYFDEKGKMIKTVEYATVPKTFTELSKPVAPSDTVIYLKAVPGYKHQKNYGYVVAFEAKEDESDLPTKKISSRIKSLQIANGVVKVTLSKPVFASLPAGTKVRLHYDTSFYQSVPAGRFYNKIGKDWKTFGGTRKIPAFVKNFRPVIIYYDHSKNPTKTFLLRNFKLIEE